MTLLDKKLIDYLPPVLGRMKDFQVLMDTEQENMNYLWDATKGTLREEFLDSQGIYGITRWEKILNLYPKSTDTLDIRNYRILAKLNERLPFTIRMLRERIHSMIKEGEYQVFCYPDFYLLEVIITGCKLRELQIIRSMIEEMLPLNLIFTYAGREVIKFYISIKIENIITFLSNFYPRYNIASLFLDNEAILDGSYTLNGYKGSECIDFYPVNLLVSGAFQHDLKLFECFSYLANIRLSTREDLVIWMRSDFYPRCNIPLFRLDGTQYLDGTHTLNEMDQDFESLFLDGDGCLDGEYITNGYMDCHNFDFYPLQMKIKGECEQKSVVSGFLHSITHVKLLPKSNSLLNVVGEAKGKVCTEEICSIKGGIGKIDISIEEKLTVEKDLYFLDGEQGLDGAVFLDADQYELKL